MNIRFITRVMMLAAASVTALSMLMAGAQAEVRKAKAGPLASAHAQVPAPTLAPAQPSTMRYFGGPKSPSFLAAR
jgi:hypothetical protein